MPVRALLLALLLPLAALARLPTPGTPGAPQDARYCGEPARDARGRIVRHRAELRRFAAVFPCPATLEAGSTSCPGWAIDHVIPLASGGCDTPINLQWLPTRIKSCAGQLCKDRWERRYHSLQRQRINLKGSP